MGSGSLWQALIGDHKEGLWKTTYMQGFCLLVLRRKTKGDFRNHGVVGCICLCGILDGPLAALQPCETLEALNSASIGPSLRLLAGAYTLPGSPHETCEVTLGPSSQHQLTCCVGRQAITSRASGDNKYLMTKGLSPLSLVTAGLERA